MNPSYHSLSPARGEQHYLHEPNAKRRGIRHLIDEVSPHCDIARRALKIEDRDIDHAVQSGEVPTPRVIEPADPVVENVSPLTAGVHKSEVEMMAERRRLRLEADQQLEVTLAYGGQAAGRAQPASAAYDWAPKTTDRQFAATVSTTRPQTYTEAPAPTQNMASAPAPAATPEATFGPPDDFIANMSQNSPDFAA